MKIPRFVALLATSVFLMGASAPAGPYGVWQDDARKSAYWFLDNDYFEYLIVDGGQGYKGSGVWTFSPGQCWLGEKKQSVGNLMLYFDTVNCCLDTRFFGRRLVMTKVWMKGYSEVETRNSVCENRVLVPRE